MNALERVQAVLGLDYAGIDFGLSVKGEVLLFEANAPMVVSPPPADGRWSYRQLAYERIAAAIRNMLTERALASERSMFGTQPPTPSTDGTVLAPRY